MGYGFLQVNSGSLANWQYLLLTAAAISAVSTGKSDVPCLPVVGPQG
jgi:hypothetical protein